MLSDQPGPLEYLKSVLVGEKVYPLFFYVIPV